LKDEGNIVFFDAIKSNDNKYGSVLFKRNDAGQNQWAKMLSVKVSSVSAATYSIRNVSEQKDGSFICLGNIDKSLFISKLSSDGKLIWNYSFLVPVSLTNKSYLSLCVNDAAGNIYCLLSDEESILVAKFSENGEFKWCRKYFTQLVNPMFNFFIDRNEQLVVSIGSYPTGESEFVFFKIAKEDGKVVAQKRMPYPKHGLLSQTDKSNADIYATYYPDEINDLSVNILNKELNVIKSFKIKSFFELETINMNCFYLPDGKLVLLNTLLPNRISYVILSDEYKILEQKTVLFSGKKDWTITSAQAFVDANKLWLQSIMPDATGEKTLIDLIRFNVGIKESNDCFTVFEKKSEVIDKELPVVEDKDIITGINEISPVPTDIQLLQEDISASSLSICDEYGTCTKPLISGPQSVYTNVPVTFIVHKDEACQKKINWKIDKSGISSFTILNDTTISIVFSKEWEGFLYAGIDGSDELTDSLEIHAYNFNDPAVISCKDSSTFRMITVRRQIGEEAVSQSFIKPLANGNILVQPANSFGAGQFFSKLDSTGGVAWSKKFSVESTKRVFGLVSNNAGAIGLRDGSVLMADVNASEGFLTLAKLDVDGNILWTKSYNPFGDSWYSNLFRYAICKTDDNGNIYLFLLDSGVGEFMFVKLSAQGEVLWSQALSFAGFRTIFQDDLFIDDDGNLVQCFVNEKRQYLLVKFDAFDGNIKKQRIFNTGASFLVETIFTVQKENGWYLLRGYDRENKNTYVVIVVDENWNPVKNFRVKYSSDVNSVKAFLTSQNQLLISSRVLGSEQLYYQIIDSSNNIVAQKKFSFSNKNFDEKFRVRISHCDGNRIFIAADTKSQDADSYSFGLISLPKDAVSANSCFTLKDTIFNQPIIPFSIKESDEIPEIERYDIQLKERTEKIIATDVPMEAEEVCKEYSICEKPVIKGVDSVCINVPVTFTVHKNDECFKQIDWMVNTTAVDSIIHINDTTINIIFKKDWEGEVYAAINDNVCHFRDAKKVVAYSLPRLDFGKDTSICYGDSIILKTADRFASYLWSDGSTNDSLTVKTKGEISVKATREDGCVATGTKRILAVYPVPQIPFPSKDYMCVNDDTLFAGDNLSKIVWQDGSNGKFHQVTQVGEYSVFVTDKNSCSNSAAITIKNLYPQPQNFLFADTAICFGESVVIRPNEKFNSYLWSDNSTANSIKVKKAGYYWLTVSDSNHCVGADTVEVTYKKCYNRLILPNSFSPNGDGANDLFKPYIEGLLENYELSLYNRLGQLVFRTNNPFEGWNGTLNNIAQNQGTYIWMCKYKFQEERVRIEKGYVLLIK
jgi:gliding motility-associated-like protein